MILSIDVGIKNLALCLLDPKDKRIVQWEVGDVPPESTDGLFRALCRHLDAREWLLDAQTVLVEKQPFKNKRMKMVENFLHAYFIIKIPGGEVIEYDARHKIPDVVGAGKAQYKKRKQTAVTRCAEFLDSCETNRCWLETFKTSKKKDDLADTVMQALSYVNRRVADKKSQGTRGQSQATGTKSIKSRKPTENQKETKYSIPNLAWLVKQEKDPQVLMKNKRFVRDLKRYFATLDELIKAMSP